MGKTVKSVAGGGLIGQGKDLLFGKKEAGTAGGFVSSDLSAEQNAALGQYNKLLDTDTQTLANSQINAQTTGLRRAAEVQEAGARQAAQDAQMNAQKMVAQRGLGNSSVGLNAVLNQSRGLSEKIGDIRANEFSQRAQIEAQQPMLAYNLKTQNLATATGGINNILGTRERFYQQGTAGGRKGGLAPLVGAAAGAYFGGPQGAQIGMGLGQAAQSSFS